MKILLVEDDQIIWPNIKEYLEENNFLVSLKTDWEEVYREAKRNKYDIFLLIAKEDLASIKESFLITIKTFLYFFNLLYFLST